MDKVLNIGVDGFKCDGADPLILLLKPPKKSSGTLITYRKYANLYYGNFYNHTK